MCGHGYENGIKVKKDCKEKGRKDIRSQKIHVWAFNFSHQHAASFELVMRILKHVTPDVAYWHLTPLSFFLDPNGSTEHWHLFQKKEKEVKEICFIICQLFSYSNTRHNELLEDTYFSWIKTNINFLKILVTFYEILYFNRFLMLTKFVTIL